MLEAILTLAVPAISIHTLLMARRLCSTGWLIGAIFMMVASMFSSMSLYLVARVSAHREAKSYAKLVEPSRQGIASIAVIVYLLNILVGSIWGAGYLLNRSLDFMTGVVGDPWWLSARFLGALLVVVGFLPVSLFVPPNKASIIAGVCMLYIVGLTIFDFCRGPSAVDVDVVRYSPLYFTCRSILFTLVNHFALPGALAGMTNPTTARQLKLVTGSSILVLVVNLLVGILGYLHFGKADLGRGWWLLCAPKAASWPYAIGQMAAVLLLISSFPSFLIPVRDAIEVLCCKGKTKRHATTAVLVTVASAMAISYSDIFDFFLSLTAPLFASLIIFIIPADAFFHLRQREADFEASLFETVMAWITLIFGLCLLVVGMVFNIWWIFACHTWPSY